jgi:hypothetical protein
MSGQKIIDGLQQAIEGKYTIYKKHVGICIDGPLVGKRLVFDYPIYVMPIYDVQPILYLPSLTDIEEKLEIKSFEYRHDTIRFYNYNEAVGVWFDNSKSGRRSEEYVLKTLLDFFVKHSDGV